MNPLLTVGVINFNQGHYIDKCLDTIRNQDFQDFELYVIDDMSSDNSVELIQAYLRRHDLNATLVVNTTNQGICKNLNQLLSVAKGKYFSFIAADDWGDSNRFSSMIGLLESSGDNICTIYSDAVLVDEKEQLLFPSYLHHFRPDLTVPPTGNIFLELLSYNFIPAMATVSRTHAIRSVQGFDENLKFEDFDLWLKLANKYEFIYTADSKCYYRILENSLIRTLGARKWEDLFLIYSKYLDKSTQAKQIIDKIMNKCLENLYFNDSAKFTMCVEQFEASSKLTGKVKALKVLRRIGFQGSQIKTIVNKIAGRKS